ncbi:Vacuolar protein sorting-associated protein 28 [Spathaspora sp. JA1]|nr:Vacuolar protein sorting-associated protein 28 [Spathaspora sp. JA1]
MNDSKTLPEYAPTSTTSYTVSASSSQYNSEITKSSLFKTPLHKSVYDSLAEIYSILPTLEMLEVSYIKDYITDKERYTSTSYRLINQYQIIMKGFIEDSEKLNLVGKILPGLDINSNNFLTLLSNKFQANCPHAIKRLQSGVPATIEHLSTQVESLHPSLTTPPPSTTQANTSAKLISQITGNFITCMDAVKLNYKTKSQLHPLLSELVVNLNDLVENEQHKSLEFSGKSKLINWLIKVNNLQDGQEIDPNDADILLNDLDTAYKGFYTSLE